MPKKKVKSIEARQKEFMRFAKKSDVSIIAIHESYVSSYSGVDLKARDGHKKSLMDYAARVGSIDLIIWLALAGVDVSLQDSKGKTSLYHAVDKDQIETALLLLLLGADILSRTIKGRTPLTVEGYTNKSNIINLLKAIHHESSSLMCQLGAVPENVPSLSSCPRWAERVPSLMGRIREIEQSTWNRGLNVFLENQPLLALLFSMVNSDKKAKEIAADVVVHQSPEKQKPVVARQIQNAYISTPGLRMPDATQQLMRGVITSEECIRLSEEEIRYHAQLRLQFAFYLLTVYYKTRIEVKLTETHDQEGKGSDAIHTRACHSALISDVKEEFRWKDGVVIVPGKTRSSRSNSESMDKSHVSPASFFRTVLNKTTVELHTAVNQYDAELEGRTTIGGAKPARRKLFEVLQKVSLGDMNPLQGLELFLIALVEQNGLLGKIEQEYVQQSADTSPSSMRRIIHGYIFEEALSMLGENGSHLRRSYVASLLFMNRDDRRFIADCSEEALTEKSEAYFMTLQEEITSNRM